MRKVLLGFLCLSVIGCQTAHEKDLALVHDRAEKFKSLGQWHPMECRVETQLTQPAIARYHELYPNAHLKDGTLTYTWKARKNACEVVSAINTPLAQNHRAFVDNALCMLLQVHYVNSPFSQLQLQSTDVVDDEGRAHIRTSPEAALGIYLDPRAVEIETKTKSRGTLKASYAELGTEWVPIRLEQDTQRAKILVDGMEYEGSPVNGRKALKSFWISVGDQNPLQHTQVKISSCREL